MLHNKSNNFGVLCVLSHLLLLCVVMTDLRGKIQSSKEIHLVSQWELETGQKNSKATKNFIIGQKTDASYYLCLPYIHTHPQAKITLILDIKKISKSRMNQKNCEIRVSQVSSTTDATVKTDWSQLLHSEKDVRNLLICKSERSYIKKKFKEWLTGPWPGSSVG